MLASRPGISRAAPPSASPPLPTPSTPPPTSTNGLGPRPRRWSPVGAPPPLESAAARLRAALEAERNPALVAMRDAARSHGVNFLAGEDAVSVGSGTGVRVWPERAIPAASQVPWPEVHDIPIALVTGSNGKTTRGAAARRHGHRGGPGHRHHDDRRRRDRRAVPGGERLLRSLGRADAASPPGGGDRHPGDRARRAPPARARGGARQSRRGDQHRGRPSGRVRGADARSSSPRPSCWWRAP